MDISDIATTEFIEVDVGERLGKVRSVFENENPKGIIVTRDGEYEGVLSERVLLQSHVEDDAKVKALVKPSRNAPAPKVDRHEDVRETARVLVEGGVKVAPVFEGDNLWGIVTADDILDAVLHNLDALTVEQIYSDDPVTLGEQDSLGKVINLLREHGISRLPVVNEGGYLSGVVTRHDIADVVIRDMNKATTGERAGDTDRVLDMPVYDIMTSPVMTTTVDASVEEAVSTMLENDLGGLVVVNDDDDRLVTGVVTKTDVLRALTFTEEEHMDVQITNINLLDTLSREEIRQSLEEVVDKYQKMDVLHVHVRFQEHKEKLRGTPLIYSQIRVRTTNGQVAGSGEGYGAESAFRVALDKLERNVLEMKNYRSDEQYRGQLLRKLDEL
ncbi:CBS domain-containing protein [Haloarchaeobius sp. HME9146]|uniref:CBS domain-containing protein n=1 Tax=Haloarchaeobius sp. HME9146 TaxID=2978732 RepID=UPI0021BE9934|nr:CBS domain-containing protein [Haloarchaeobius sp. HME9146]MCT9097490.1 CBS domain-containing protein [Haloarchaeobius sp. HME9146]